MNPAITATATIPGHVPGGICAGSTGCPIASATTQYTTAVEVISTAAIAEASAPPSDSWPTRSVRSPECRAARMIHAEYSSGEATISTRPCDRWGRGHVDAADGQDHAQHRDPQRRPGAAALQRPAEAQGEHGDHRGIQVDDEGGERQRDRRDRGVVRRGVGHVEHAQPDRPQQRPAGEGCQRPSGARSCQQQEPPQGAGDREPPGQQRQPVHARGVHGFREQSARAEGHGADDDQRDAGDAGSIHDARVPKMNPRSRRDRYTCSRG